MLRGYQKAIQEATGCKDSEAAEIEDIMRHSVFHSTLDWIPKKEFDEGAVLAYQVFKEINSNSPMYQEILKEIDGSPLD